MGKKKIVSKTKVLSLPVIGDQRGSLIAIEDSNIPFSIKRVYYIFDTKEKVSRGFHAHIKLKQLLIAVSGSVNIKCVNTNLERKDFLLNAPNKGLLIEGLVWREMHDFSPGAVLLVLASEHYDEMDYIRDFKKFESMCKK